MNWFKTGWEVPLRIILALGAIPIVPVIAGPKSDKISPNKFDPTTTSNQSGLQTKWAVKMSMEFVSLNIRIVF